MQNEEEKYELNAETSKEFVHVKGAPPVFDVYDIGHIDIRTLTPEKAKALIEAGCKHIVAKNPETAVKPTKPTA